MKRTRSHHRVRSRWFLLLILPLLVIACQAGPKVQEPTKGDVYVYVASPLSGFQANGGQTVLGGVNVAAEELNRAGGLLGYRVVVLPLDDESDSDVAVEVAQQVAAEVGGGRRVIGLIGHYNSGQTLAAMEIYQGLSIVVITPTASELSITQRGYRNFFRVNANDAVQADVDALFLVQELGAKRVAVLHNDTEYGIGLAEQMQRALGERGAEAVTVIQVTEGQEVYDQEVAQIQSAAPDAIFYAGYEIEAPFLRHAVVQAGITVPFLASDGALLTATIDDADGAADGMYVSGFAPSPQQVAASEWIDLYREVEYRNPDTYSVNGYVAMRVLAAGVESANSLDAAAVSGAIRTTSIDTPIGQLSYADNGDLKDATIYIFEVQGDRFVQTYP